MSKYYNSKTKELKNQKVLETLKELPRLYDNGDIMDVYNEICYLLKAFEEFIDDYEI